MQSAHEAMRHRKGNCSPPKSTPARRLHQIATQLITAQGSPAPLQEILDTAKSLVHSHFASIQMFYPDHGSDGELLLLCHIQ